MADVTPENVKGASLSGLIATLVPTLLISVAFFSIFLFLRRSQRRYYAPRTYLGSLREEERSEPLPSGWFNWIGPFWKTPDTYVLQHQSLDAFLFLRFLKITVVIMFVGALITWPILYPVYITGGVGGGQLDLLSMANIDKSGSGQYRYYAPLGAGAIFFGFVFLLVTREIIFYINLRQAFLLSPLYGNRISVRTVLFTSVPEALLDESKLRQIFGESVNRIWITRDTAGVDELVEERDKVAFRLESAEVKLIKLVNEARAKSIKKNGTDVTTEEPAAVEGDVENGSLAGRWVPEKKRPTHKLGFLGFFGKKVDTIAWSRSRLAELIPATEAAQVAYRDGDTKRVGSVFIEFARQSDAQSAFQTLSHHQALHMSQRYVGIHPNEIIWSSLKISWWQRILRRIFVVSFISALIIFWAIPVAFVGLVSNITYLESYSWLSWLEKIPNSIMGIISGLLPAALLSVLMSLVPIIMRALAKQAGEPSLARVELFTQNAYFVFQVVQVFLVVTVASSASSILKQIIDEPTGITALLSTRLPTASNFYISYFIVQGLTVASGVISQVLGFVIFHVLYKYLSGTPRAMYQKWANLSAISWGSTLPVFTNIAVIGLTYSCIAPLILGFATIGMSLFYLAYRYNILFVTDSQIDTKGLIYPRALQQLLTGIYLAQICMIGLFSIAGAIGPIVLQVVFLIFTILYHLSLNSAIDPLLHNLPKSLEVEEQTLRVESGLTDPDNKEKHDRIIAPAKKPNFIAKFLAPHIYSDYATLRALVPQGDLGPENICEDNIAEKAYYPPAVSSEVPLLWIPKDEIGVSAQEVAETSKIIPITDDGATIDAKNKIIWDPEGVRPPVWKPKICY